MMCFMFICRLEETTLVNLLPSLHKNLEFTRTPRMFQLFFLDWSLWGFFECLSQTKHGFSPMCAGWSSRYENVKSMPTWVACSRASLMK